MNSKLTHLPHFEDVIFTHGPDQVAVALALIESQPSTQVKLDGISLVCGPDPADGRFFVSTKAFHNKKPKAYHSVAEMAELEEGLREKLEVCFNSLSTAGFTRVHQGDLLDILPGRGIEHLCPDETGFIIQPNVIVYETVGIRRLSGVLVSFHTSYDGDMLLKTVEAVESPKLVMIDPNIEKLRFDFGDLTDLVKFAPATILPDEIRKLALLYTNFCIREELSSANRFSGFVHFVKGRFEAAAYKLKTPRGKRNALKKLETLQELILENSELLRESFQFQEACTVFKTAMLSTLKFDHLLPFKRTASGKLRPWKHEGAVITGSDFAFKLVDRREFSRENFLAHAK